MGTVTRLTDEEFLNLEDEPGKQELLDGELIAVGPTEDVPSRTMGRFYDLLSRTVDDRQMRIRAGYRLKPGWLQPDVSVNWPDQPVDRWLVGSPMIAIEVVSPS